MSQFLQLHPKDPQPRLVKRVVDIVHGNGLIVYPTDSSYAFGCNIDNKQGLERICRLRRLSEDHNFTLICKDLAQVSTYAKMNNEAFRLIKSLTPGPFTFILEATRETPRRIQHAKRKTIGIRLPDDPITRAILSELDAPLFSSTLLLPDEEDPMTDPLDIRDRLENEVELVIDSGVVPYNPTTIIDLTGSHPEIVRQGAGVATNIL